MQINFNGGRFFRGRFLSVLLLGMILSPAIGGAEESGLRVFGARPGALVRAKALLATGDNSLKPALAKLIEDAEKALAVKPPSVMEKPKAADSGDKHDYLSTAPYFWPDPGKPDGRPYIRKDGQRNPESHNEFSDSPRMGRMSGAAHTLALAYYFTGREEFAAHGARLLRVWFIDPGTRMNPNFNFAQAVPGVNTGRGTGMIESRSLLGVADAVALLAGSKHWTEEDGEAMKRWMGQFVEWAQTSKNGRDEQAAKNNHGSFYDLQIAHLELFLDATNRAKEIIQSVGPRRIALQIKADGSQPLELAREDSFGYSRFNLQALCSLAILGEHVGVDLWHYESPDGGSIRKAIDFLLPYVEDTDKPWPFEKGKKQNRSLTPVLRQAEAAYGVKRYAEILTKVPGLDRDRDTLYLVKGKP